MSHEPEDIQAELAALADGTLPDGRREQLLAQIADSPELTSELESQRHAVALMRTLEHVEAPSLLRRSIETLTAGGTETASARSVAPRHGRRPLRLAPRLAAAVALAAVAAVAVTLALTAGSTSAPTVLEASSLAQGPSTQAAPTESPHHPHLLAASAAGISYPYWGGRLGWRAVGARTDSVGGRTLTTVFYSDHAARRIAYSIVSGGALPVPAGSATIERRGVRFQIVRPGGPTVVTWRQAGHTCILTAHAVPAGTLVRLASWERT
ncbi:MAG: hypothetical protein ACHQE6_00290 [Solirubrobacterales bacterium]